MSYQTALSAAGAIVIDTLYSGDYQGSWGSIVEYNGKLGLVTGAFGSCTGCDAYEAEFNNYTIISETIEYNERTGKYTSEWGTEERTKEEYDKQQAEHQRKLAEFGGSYLQVIQDKWDIENQLANMNDDNWFDDNDKTILEWALKIVNEYETM